MESAATRAARTLLGSVQKEQERLASVRGHAPGALRARAAAEASLRKLEVEARRARHAVRQAARLKEGLAAWARETSSEIECASKWQENGGEVATAWGHFGTRTRVWHLRAGESAVVISQCLGVDIRSESYRDT